MKKLFNKDMVLQPLNGIKLLGSIVIAFFFHWNHLVDTQRHPLYNFGFGFFCKNGYMAVETFFIISGITFLLLYANKIRECKICGTEFALLRFSRLYPVHIATLLFVAFFQILRNVLGLEQFKFVSNDLYHFIQNVFMFHDIGISDASFNWPAWAISVFVIVYFLFFWLCKVSKSNSQLCVFSIIIMLFGLKNIRYDYDSFFITSNLSRGYVSFFSGVIFALILMNYKGKKAILDAIFGAFIFTYLIFRYFMWIDLRNDYRIMAYCFNIFVIIPIIYYSVRINLLRELLSCRLMKRFSNLSFSIYMVHYPLQVFLVTINDYFKIGLDYSSLFVWGGMPS